MPKRPREEDETTGEQAALAKPAAGTLRLAALQFRTCADRASTLQKAEGLIARAAREGAQVCVLPEAFTGLYGVRHFAANAEEEGSQSSGTAMMACAAAEHGLHVVGGVIEKEGEKLYNTIFVYGPSGKQVARYRKLHLSRVHVANDRTAEGDILTAGEELVTFDVAGFRIGLLNCFDLRFSDAASVLVRKLGCHVLLYPSAWLASTGDLGHWECLLRARALDGGCYVAGINVARDEAQDIVCFGGSRIFDPLAREVARCRSDQEDDVLIADLSMECVLDTRRRIPLRAAARHDVYDKY